MGAEHAGTDGSLLAGLLQFLFDGGDFLLKAIAERLLITTGSMTSLLDTLQKRGLIRRLPHPGDRRKLLVGITPDAQLIVDEFLPSLHARERELISAALTTSEQRQLLRHLAKTQQAAIRAGPAPPIRDARHTRPDRTTGKGNLTRTRTGPSQARAATARWQGPATTRS